MLSKTIPAYLYQQYNDDESLQAFVSAYNTKSQDYVAWFNAINLPIYTGAPIVGDLLDWEAAGLYGMVRPSLSASGSAETTGPLNTAALNTAPLNGYESVGGSSPDPAVTDDIFKRILTWHFYKGDGKTFSVRWLKRRVVRFLYGVNGTDVDVGSTYDVSVTFGPDTLATITLTYAENAFSGIGIFAIGVSPIGGVPIPSDLFAFAPVLKAGIEGGVLELPFQFTYAVDISAVT